MNGIFAVFSIIGMVAVVVVPLYWYLKREQRETLLRKASNIVWYIPK